MNINDFNIKNLTIMSIARDIRNEVNLVPDIIKPGIQGIFCAVGGALFTHAYGFLTQQKSYKNGYVDGHMEGYNRGYSEGFSQGYNEGFNQIALIAGAVCVGTICGAAAMNYFQRRTQIANVQTNQAISNNLALAE